MNADYEILCCCYSISSNTCCFRNLVDNVSVIRGIFHATAWSCSLVSVNTAVLNSTMTFLFMQ